MEERDLRKLKRQELMEIMLAQSEEIDRLRAELQAKDAELADRRIAIEESGSIAEAALRLTNVFEEAQRAADIYLENVKAQAGAAATGSDGAPDTPDVTPATRRAPRHAAGMNAAGTVGTAGAAAALALQMGKGAAHE